MKFQRVRYDTGENIIEIKIRDGTGKFIENWVLMMSDLSKWVDIIRRKYGLRFEKQRERDLDWAIWISLIDIYKEKLHIVFMKLKDFFGKIVENKKTKQNILSPKKRILKENNVSIDDLLNMKVNVKLKKLLENWKEDKMKFTSKELRENKFALLRRIQRQVDTKNQSDDLEVFNKLLNGKSNQTSFGEPKKTKLYLLDKRKGK